MQRLAQLACLPVQGWECAAEHEYASVSVVPYMQRDSMCTQSVSICISNNQGSIHDAAHMSEKTL